MTRQIHSTMPMSTLSNNFNGTFACALALFAALAIAEIAQAQEESLAIISFPIAELGNCADKKS